MKKAFGLLVLAAACVALPSVAHESGKARRGGVVQTSAELNFELVGQDGQDGKAVLYVDDHGKPLPTAGMSGKLTVLNGADKSEAELRPAGDNKLEAAGVKLAKGAKVVAALKTGSGKAVTVRFTVK